MHFPALITILSSLYFKYFIVPLITSFLCIFVKWVSKNDRFITFKKGDLAVGLEMIVASLIIFITDSVNLSTEIIKNKENQVLQGKLMAIPWVLLAFIMGLWGVSTIIRRWGWKNENELNLFWGIIFPDIVGVLILIFIVNWIGK